MRGRAWESGLGQASPMQVVGGAAASPMRGRVAGGLWLALHGQEAGRAAGLGGSSCRGAQASPVQCPVFPLEKYVHPIIEGVNWRFLSQT